MEGSSHWTHRVVQQTSRSQQEFSAWEHLGAHWTRAQCLHWPAAASCPRGVHTEFRETTSGSQSCLVPGSAQLLSCVFQCSKGHWEIDKLMLFELVAVADSCISPPLIVCTIGDVLGLQIILEQCALWNGSCTTHSIQYRPQEQLRSNNQSKPRCGN